MAKVKMTNNEILALNQGLMSVSTLTGAKFSYAVAKNIREIKRAMDVIREAGRMSREYSEFDSKRGALAMKYAKKKDGEPEIIDDGGVKKYNIEDEKAFEKAVEKMKVDNKDVIEARKKQLEDLKKLLDKEVEIDLHLIDPEYISDDINSKQMADIMPIIKE